MRDLRIATGFGEMIGGDGAGLEVLLFCQRSRTGATFFPPKSFLSGREGELGDAAVNWLVACTMLRTKPRPCSRLILGVGSLGGVALRKAGEGLDVEGSWGPRERRGEG